MLLKIKDKDTNREFDVVITDEKTNTMLIRTVDVYPVTIDYDSCVESINNMVLTSNLVDSPKLPKFWSYKNNYLMYKTGIFAHSHDLFINDLKKLIANFCLNFKN